RTVLGFPRVFTKPPMQVETAQDTDGMPHPAVVDQPATVGRDGQAGVEVIQIMLRTRCRSVPPPRGTARGEERAMERIRKVQAVPVGRMHQDRSITDDEEAD